MIETVLFYAWYLIVQDPMAGLVMLGVPGVALAYYLAWRMQ